MTPEACAELEALWVERLEREGLRDPSPESPQPSTVNPPSGTDLRTGDPTVDLFNRHYPHDALQRQDVRRRVVTGKLFHDLGIPRKLLSSSYWRWYSSFLALTADAKGLKDFVDNNRMIASLDRSNFLSCSSRRDQHASSMSLVSRDGTPVLGVSPRRCGRPECPDCRDKKAKGEAEERVRIISWLRDTVGLRRAWTLVFTVPEHISSDDRFTGKLLDAVRDTIRNYWKGHKPGFVLDEHLIGDQDPLKTRLHVHATVIPAEHTADGWRHLDDGQPLDLDRLRSLWTRYLRKHGLLGDGEVPINPEARWFSVDGKSLKRLSHRLSYDSRGFGKDFKHAVLWSVKDDDEGPDLRLVIKRTEKRWQKGKHRRIVTGVDYQVLPLARWAERWLWLVNHTPKTRVYGFLRRYPDDLRQHLETPEPLDLHWTGEWSMGRIERERYRTWDQRKRRVVNVANDFYCSKSGPSCGSKVLIDGTNVRYISSGLAQRLREDYNARCLQASRASLISVLTARIQAEEQRLYEALEAEARETERLEAEGWYFDPHGGPGGEGAWVNPDLEDLEDFEA